MELCVRSWRRCGKAAETLASQSRNTIVLLATYDAHLVCVNNTITTLLPLSFTHKTSLQPDEGLHLVTSNGFDWTASYLFERIKGSLRVRAVSTIFALPLHRHGQYTWARILLHHYHRIPLFALLVFFHTT
jgi:hypothetical protein